MRSRFGIRWAIALFAALNLLDMASTYVALQSGMAEGNHIPSMLLAAGGEPAMYLFKAAMTLLVIVSVIRLSPYFRRLGYGLHAANGVLALVVTLNLAQLLVL